MQQWLTGHKLKNRPYEILQILGEGGFGITYKAKNLSLDVPVVIKTPNRKLQRDKNYSKYLESFKKEAKQLAKLGMNPHPHIVRVFDFFEEDNLPCIIMDYVPGNSLYDLVQMNGVLAEERALEYIRQIGSALSVCHQRGIIHRDVHPNNILIHAESGKAILIDFGISGTTQSSRNTRSGNQAFAPWEQLISFGEQSSKTPQVDIYTLAASFYYLITGDTPTPSLARKFNNDDLIEPKQHNFNISDRINKAILKGMEIKPDDRPQSVEVWLEMLKPLQPKSKPDKDLVKLQNHSELKSENSNNSNSEQRVSKSFKVASNVQKDQKVVENLLDKRLNPNDVSEINNKLKIDNGYKAKRNNRIKNNQISKSIRLKNYEKKVKSLLDKGLNPNGYYFQERMYQYRIQFKLKSSDIFKVNEKLNIKDNFETKFDNPMVYFVLLIFLVILVVLVIPILT